MAALYLQWCLPILSLLPSSKVLTEPVPLCLVCTTDFTKDGSVMPSRMTSLPVCVCSIARESTVGGHSRENYSGSVEVEAGVIGSRT